MNDVIKRKGRGLGKKPALVYMPTRVNKEVIDFFNQHFPNNKQEKIREVLNNFINQYKGQKDDIDFQHTVLDILYNTGLDLYKQYTQIPDTLIQKLLLYDLHLTPQNSVFVKLLHRCHLHFFIRLTPFC